MQNKNYKDAPFSSLHKKVFLCFILGQIACGYALGIAGTAVTQAIEPLGLNSFWVGLLGAGTLIGLSGSIVVGNVADKLGRRKLFLIDMILFTVISLAQFVVSNTVILLILRIGLGLSIAIDYTVGSALLTEWLPSKKSAQFQSYLIIFWTIGYVASFTAKEGYGGDISLSMGVAADGTITGLEVLSASETAGLGANCTTDAFKSQFAGINSERVEYTKMGKSADNEIDALSGATITTKAITKAVNSLLLFLHTSVMK